MRTLLRKTLAATFLLATAAAAGAQTPPRDRAAAFVAEGRLERALDLLDSLIAAGDAHQTATLERGHVLAWLGRDAEAQRTFEEVLAGDEADLSALLGLAHNHAWRGRHAEAERAFERVLSLDPTSQEAAEGLAHLALWRGDPDEAARAFERLAAGRPGDPELVLALGRAHLAAGHPRAARDAFRRALELEPWDQDARFGLESATRIPSTVELTVWGGFTSFGGTGDGLPSARSRLGLRSARLAVRPAPGVTVWGRVDDGLSYDNRGLAAAADHVPSYTLGGLIGWRGRFATRLEAGWREVGSVGQALLAAEQVAALPAGLSVKAGGWVGAREDDRTEWVAYGGAGLDVTPRWTVESVAFVSGSGLPGGDGKRVLVASQYRFGGGWEAGGGAAYGSSAIAQAASDHVAEGFLHASAPVAGIHRVHVALRHQRLARSDDVTVAAVGVSLGVWGR